MSRKPDLVFLLPDQLRRDFVGAYGADFLNTPHIDSLARGGTVFQSCVSAAPICLPARASMLTGQSAHSAGVMDNIHWIRPDRAQIGVRSWPEHLADGGYRTAAIGKMHFYPWDLSEGFHERIIAEDKRHFRVEDDYHDALVARGYARSHAREQRGYAEQKGASFNDLPDDLQIDRWVAAQTCRYIENADPDTPLALMVGFPGPHCPYDPPEEAIAAINPDRLPRPIPPTEESSRHHPKFVATYKRDWADIDYSELSVAEAITIRRHYAALVERLDADVGAILGALERSGRLDNAVVVFASDHGDYLGDFGLVGKTFFHEPSIMVPLMLKDYRAKATRSVEAPVSLVDLMPTFLDIAGCDPAPAAEGVSLLRDARPDRVIVGATIHGAMARGQRWKLVRYRDGGEALFDLANDPQEQRNVIAQQPGRRAELDQAMLSGLLNGFASAHADKLVSEAHSTDAHPFYRRGWTRPYPCPAYRT